jgi:hypothetical protein
VRTVDPDLAPRHLRPTRDRDASRRGGIARGAALIALAAAQFLASYHAAMMAVGILMPGFFSPAAAALSIGDQLMVALAAVLAFPVVTFWPLPPSASADYRPFAANSLLWAACIGVVSRRCRRRPRRG